MKITIALMLLSAALLTACGKKETAAPSASAPAAQGAREIVVTGSDAMKFDVASIATAPGEEIKIVFKNIGTLPKEAMGHNFVLLKKGTDLTAFATAAMTAKATDYIPPSLAGNVIAHTKVLGPKQSETLTLKAPTEPGDYPYLCSFPGHAVLMRGVLTVK